MPFRSSLVSVEWQNVSNVNGAEDSFFLESMERPTPEEDPKYSVTSDYEGLQLSSVSDWIGSSNSEPRNAGVDSEGLQRSPLPDSLNDPNRESEAPEALMSHHAYPLGSEPVVGNANPGSRRISNEAKKRRRTKGWSGLTPLAAAKCRKRLWKRLYWFAAVVIAIPVILGAVLGGVLGTRARWASGASQPQAQSPVRIKSVTGTWNGTAITAALDGTGLNGNLFFQRFAGDIISMPFTFNPASHNISIDAGLTSLGNIAAANDTGLAVQMWPGVNQSAVYQLIYTHATNASLCDVWQGTPPSRVGILSNQNITLAAGYRPTLCTIANSAGKPFTRDLGMSLFVGNNPDGLHQYNLKDRIWSSETSNTAVGSWESGGGCTAVDTSSGNGTCVRTVILSDKSGQVMSYKQMFDQDGYMAAQNSSSWNKARETYQKAMANTSVAFSLQTNSTGAGVILFSNASDGKLTATNVNLSGWTKGNDDGDAASGRPTGPISDGAQLGRQFAVMQGSDMSMVRPHQGAESWNLLFYQDEGTSLAWLVLDDTAVGVRGWGHIEWRDNTWVVR